MIRRNVVSVVAVCGALAVGIAVGGGPLSDLGHAAPDRSTTAASVVPEAVRAQADLGSDFARSVGPTLTSGVLSGQRVAVVAMPGAEERVAALVAQVKAAGGSIGSVVDVQPTLADTSRKTFADTISSRLAGQYAGRVARGLTTYERLGQVVGATYAAHVTIGAYTADQQTASKTLVAAKLVKVSQSSAPARLVLVVLGDHVDETVLPAFVRGLGRAADGLVAVGDSASATGDLKVLRAQKWDGWFASVDGVETTMGQVATPLALARQVHRLGGSFGASGFGGITSLR
ncbi:copper transporter [Nocardioides cheoyonin]|uniref:copper transporter n=1 Tax=Nocardioides cheoyonin TaxID=3156615 RepID=UPI0032B476F9